MKLDRKTLQALAAVSGIGFSIAASLAVGILAGHWLDRRLGTEPCALIAGIIVGLIAAGSIIYELATTFKRTNDTGQNDLDRDDSR